MTLRQVAIRLQFSTDCPDGVSLVRWRGILKFFERYMLSDEEISDYLKH